jgi:thymidine kinase
MDFLGKPFGPMPQLMAMAEYVKKVHAICMLCGNLAHHSHRTVDNPSRIMLGEQESYVPLCRSCYNRERAKMK